MERQHQEIRAPREGREGLAGPADLERPGEEDEHVALEPVADEPPHRRRDLDLERPIVGAREVLDGDVEEPALGAEHRRLEEGGDRGALERRRHHPDAEVGPRGALQRAQERESDVALEVALVELVEQDGADAGEAAIAEEPACEHALGHEGDPRARSGPVLEPHPVSHGAADLLAELLGHAPGRQPRGEPAGLEHHDLAALGRAVVEQGPRHPRRLARARGRLEDEAPPVAQRARHVGQQRIDRERLQGSLFQQTPSAGSSASICATSLVTSSPAAR